MVKYFIKNKVDFLLWFMVLLGILLAIIFYSFLPNKIPMQWNDLNVNWYAHKIAIFIHPLLCTAILLLLRPNINISLGNPIASNIVIAGLIFILISCEIYTIAYCFGLRWRIDYILLIEFASILLIGIIIAIRNTVSRKNN